MQTSLLVLPFSLSLSLSRFLYSPKDMLIDCTEREREGEKHWCERKTLIVSCTCSDQGPSPQSRHAPWCTGQHSSQLSHTGQALSLFSYSPGLLISSLLEGWNDQEAVSWRWCLDIILEKMGKMETTLKKIPEIKEGECHLYAALLHPHLSCFFPFALSFIQPFSYLMYLLSPYCLPGMIFAFS